MVWKGVREKTAIILIFLLTNGVWMDIIIFVA